MGQYYLIVNIDKRQYLYPHTFGDGQKFMEFGGSATGTLLGLAVLTSEGLGRGGGDLIVPDGEDKNSRVGSWAGDRVVTIGDYGDEGKFVVSEDVAAFHVHVKENPKKYEHRVIKEDYKPTLYEVANLFFTDISEDVRDLIAFDECCPLNPNEHHFMRDTMWPVEQRMSRGNPKPPFNFTSITIEDLQRALHGVTEKGPKFFAAYLKWIKKKPLAPSVKDYLTGKTYKKVRECP